jgi:hypothetical protein
MRDLFYRGVTVPARNIPVNTAKKNILIDIMVRPLAVFINSPQKSIFVAHKTKDIERTVEAVKEYLKVIL